MNKLINKNRELSIKLNSNNLEEKFELRDSQKSPNQNKKTNRPEIKAYKRKSLNLSNNDSIILSEKIKNNFKINNNYLRHNSVSLSPKKNINKRFSISTNSSFSSKKNQKIFKSNKKKKNNIQPELSIDDSESIYMTEIKNKIEPKKIEESKNHKYLKTKLENLKIPKRLQLGIQSSFKIITEDLLGNINIIQKKKINVDELLKKNQKSITIDGDKKDINYSLSKDNISRIHSLNYDNNIIEKELSKVMENKKMMKNYSSMIENDKIKLNINNNKIDNIKLKEDNLLNKLKINKLKIQSLIEENKNINKRKLIYKYANNNSCINLKKNNNKSRNKNLLLEIKPYYSLNEEQKKYNHQLKILNKERIKDREKMEKNLKVSKDKKIKKLDLQEKQKLILKRNYLEKLKNNEKEFLKNIKHKNDLILENSIKYINKIPKKEKDYLFNNLKEKFENKEQKLIDKRNMMKKDSFLTKKELNELSNKIMENKKILEEELENRKVKMKKMWKERSQNLPLYRSPVVDILKEEEYEKLENEVEKKKKKELNNKEKQNYKPPKVNINIKLKEIRENRYLNLKTIKKSLMKTEIDNKHKLLDTNQVYGISDSTRINPYKMQNNSNIKNALKQIHPKPVKPIDYLQIFKNKRNKRNEMKSKDEEFDKMLYDYEEDNLNKNKISSILDDFEKVKIKSEMIDKKISEKKVFLKLSGGFNLNPMLGDEIGNLLIESMKNKLNLLKKYQD